MLEKITDIAKKFFSIPEYVYLALALTFGLAFIFINPPLHFSDSREHMIRSMEIARGGLAWRTDIPKSVLEITDEFKAHYEQFLPKNAGASAPKKYDDYDIIATFASPLKKEETVNSAMAVKETAFYTPIPYAPQALAMAIGYVLDAQPTMLIYMGVMAVLLVNTAIIFLSIKITPVLKWPLCFMALLPAIIFTNGILAADAMTNSLAILYLSLILKMAIKPKAIKKHDIGVLSILVTLLCLSKSAYMILALLALLLPRGKFADMKEYISSLMIIILPGVILGLDWLLSVRLLYYPIADQWRAYREVWSDGQLNYIIAEPMLFLGLLVDKILLIPEKILFLAQPYYEGWQALIVFFVFFALLLWETKKTINMPKWQHRLIMMGIALATVVLIHTFIYLTFNTYMSPEIQGFAPRYLIPLLPLLLLMLTPKAPIFKRPMPEYLKALMIIGLTSFLAYKNLYVLYTRYYI